MGRADHLSLGTWNATCSMCGGKRKASELVRNWQGLWRCPAHNEPRHPQDFVRARPDDMSVPWSQPVSDTFIEVCTPNGITAIVGFAVVGCARVGYISPLFDPNVTDPIYG